MPRNFTQLTIDERRIVSQMLQAKVGLAAEKLAEKVSALPGDAHLRLSG
ncbi:hypothetical protein M8997_011730 [Phyllobacterium sp. 21LDTY02-6]|nr:hypothetical protein [Phyllobacterium sp. 21LDTY02-6]MCO4317852.1 hypothetical protein [Phyllobacterium sp. 21LDTY02-6]